MNIIYFSTDLRHCALLHTAEWFCVRLRRHTTIYRRLWLPQSMFIHARGMHSGYCYRRHNRSLLPAPLVLEQ